MSEREERCDRGGGGSSGGELKQHLMEIPTAAAGEEEKGREGSYAGVMHGNIGTEQEGEEMGWRGEMEGRETAASTVSTPTTTPSLQPPLHLRARLRWRWRESDASSAGICATQSVWHPAYINVRHCAPRWYSSGRAHPSGNFAAKRIQNILRSITHV